MKKMAKLRDTALLSNLMMLEPLLLNLMSKSHLISGLIQKTNSNKKTTTSMMIKDRSRDIVSLSLTSKSHSINTLMQKNNLLKKIRMSTTRKV